MITILNTSILTRYGTYTYAPLTLTEAQNIAGSEYESQSLESAVGHASTAAALTDLLGVPVPANRIDYAQEVGDQALVFKLRVRLEEGRVLSREEIEALPYEFGLLTRTA